MQWNDEIVSGHHEVLVHGPEAWAHVDEHVFCLVLLGCSIQQIADRARHIPKRKERAAKFLGDAKGRFVLRKTNMSRKEKDIAVTRHLHAFCADDLLWL